MQCMWITEEAKEILPRGGRWKTAREEIKGRNELHKWVGGRRPTFLGRRSLASKNERQI